MSSSKVSQNNVFSEDIPKLVSESRDKNLQQNFMTMKFTSEIYVNRTCIFEFYKRSDWTSMEDDESSVFSPSSEIDVHIPQWESMSFSCIFHAVV